MRDLIAFVTDMIYSFNGRIQKCTKKMMNVLTCLDMDTLISLMCGERLPNGRVKLVAGDAVLEMHGKEEFEEIFGYVCSLPHVQHLTENSSSTLKFYPAFSSAIFHRLKQALKLRLWNETSEGRYMHFKVVFFAKVFWAFKSLFEVHKYGGSGFCPWKTYELTFIKDDTVIQACLNERRAVQIYLHR